MKIVDIKQKLVSIQILLQGVKQFAEQNEYDSLYEYANHAECAIIDAEQHINRNTHLFLINDVMTKIKRDVENEDFTAIEKIMRELPKDVLQSYLSED